MHYQKWLTVVLEEIFQLVDHSPRVSEMKEGQQPSAAVALDSDPQFQNAVLIALVEDEGVFKEETFQFAYNYCEQNKLMEPHRLENLKRLVESLHNYKCHFDDLNMLLGKCPDEFLDSIMDTVMLDPVILPSGNRCDRTTLVRQLSLRSIDPFTRSPLSMDMVKPDTELKERIRNWLVKQYEELHKEREKK